MIPCSKSAAFAAAFIGGFIGLGAASAADVQVRMSTEIPAGAPEEVLLSSFRDALVNELGDQIAIDYFDSGELGDEVMHMNMVRSGQIDVYPLGSDAVQLDSKWAIFDMPFLFPDRETATRVLDGEIGEELAESMREQADLHVLGFGEIGFRHVTNNERPVVTPEDLEGLKLRVPGSETRIDVFTMLGAAPLTMGMGELYLALQQGTVDGQENPLSVIDSFSLFEVQDYLSLSGHLYTPITLVVHGPTWDAMDGETQAAFDRAARTAIEASRRYGQESDKELLDELKARMEVNEIERADFEEAAEPTWDAVAETAGEEFATEVVDAVDAASSDTARSDD